MGAEGLLSNAWYQHLASEFSANSADEALAAMAADPHANHVPLMVGGRGRDELHDFYANHYLNQLPPDLETFPVSRTVGRDRVVDEPIMRFTHSIRLDWILPGVPPTGRSVELPFVVVVQFEGDKVAQVHVYWDQASVLVQVGLLDRSLPVRGGEIAAQVLNPTQPMNELIRRASDEAGDTDVDWSEVASVDPPIKYLRGCDEGCRVPSPYRENEP
jgi:carboxymethylenebutenolidase